MVEGNYHHNYIHIYRDPKSVRVGYSLLFVDMYMSPHQVILKLSLSICVCIMNWLIYIDF